MRFAALCLLACLLGCGGGGHTNATKGPDDSVLGSDGGDGMSGCIDNDNDGFGHGCPPGPDCDDNDPKITDECTRCVTPNKDCPCKAGTMPMSCDPEDKHVTQNGVMGVLVCSEGTRYCRDSAWSDCEIIFQYATFVPDN